MTLKDARLMRRLGSFTEAILNQTADGKWIAELKLRRQSPDAGKTVIERDRGGTKLYKTVEPALRDLQAVGFRHVSVILYRAPK